MTCLRSLSPTSPWALTPLISFGLLAVGVWKAQGGEGGGGLSKPPKPSLARHAVPPTIAHNRIYFCKSTTATTPLNTALPLSPALSHPLLFQALSLALNKIMADRNSRFSVKKKEKKAEGRTSEEKENNLKKPDKVVKKPEKTPDQPSADREKKDVESGGPAGAEANNSEGNGEFQPIELPPFEIVTGWV